MHYISQIGKERKPIDPVAASGDVLINACGIAIAVIAAVRLI